MASILPVLSNVLVVLERRPEKTDGGIFIPETAQDPDGQKRRRGEKVPAGFGLVTAVGNRTKTLLPGHRVVIGPHVGTRYDAEGRAYLILKESEVLAYVPV